MHKIKSHKRNSVFNSVKNASVSEDYYKWANRMGITDNDIEDLLEEGKNTKEIITYLKKKFIDGMADAPHDIGRIWNEYLNDFFEGEIEDREKEREYKIPQIYYDISKKLNADIKESYYIDGDKIKDKSGMLIDKNYSSITKSKYRISYYSKRYNKLNTIQRIKLKTSIEVLKYNANKLKPAERKKYLEVKI